MKVETITERIKTYADWLKSHLNPKYKPTEQEQLICDIVIKMLQNPQTKRIIWEQDYLIISNSETIIRLDGGVLSIISAKGIMKMDCSPIFIDYLKSQSIKYIGGEIQQFELKIAEKELGMLTDISK